MKHCLLLLLLITSGVIYGCMNKSEKRGILSVSTALTANGLLNEPILMIKEKDGKETSLIRDQKTKYTNIIVDKQGNISLNLGDPHGYKIRGNDTTISSGPAFHVYEMEYTGAK